jgi:hypothetical protein
MLDHQFACFFHKAKQLTAAMHARLPVAAQEIQSKRKLQLLPSLFLPSCFCPAAVTKGQRLELSLTYSRERRRFEILLSFARIEERGRECLPQE